MIIMTYVAGDIHGRYDKYKELLKKIKFTDKDDLYVIGDMLDIGEKPITLIRDMSMRINVFPILGDHEYTALKMLKSNALPDFDIWIENGGKSTYDEFIRLTYEEREAVKEYLEDLPLYEDINVNGKRYILVHAGLEGFEKDRSLDDYSPLELIYKKADINKKYFDDVTLITGHQGIGDCQKKAVYKNGHLSLDCSEAGVLCAVCLDDGREFYV